MDNEKPKFPKRNGRPPKFESAEQLENAIHEYFEEGITIRTVIVGKGAAKKSVQIEIPTITGLCFYIGFASRQSFYDLEKDDKFSYIIKRARLFIEKEYEEQLNIGNTVGAIFALKNMGWKDKYETEHSGEIRTDDITGKSTEELIERAKAVKEITNEQS